jgi:predicted PurR-regulated permease PerM
MQTALSRSSVLRTLLAAASLVVVTAGLRAFAAALNPILLALLLLFLLLPALYRLQRQGLRTWQALTIIIVATLVVTVVILIVVTVSLARLAAKIPSYQDELAQRSADLKVWLADHGLDASAVVGGAQSSTHDLLRGVVSLVASLASTLVLAVVIVLFALFMLIEVPAFEARFRAALGEGSPDLGRGASYIRSISTFFATKAVLGLAAAVGDLILLLLVGVNQALLWAVLSFVCSFIPYVGYWIALIPPLLLAWLQIGPGAALVVFVGYWAINGTFDTLIGPHVLGESLDVSPTVTILSIVYWSWVLGPVGSLLALPLTVMVKMLLLERDTRTRWIATVIGATNDRR